MRTMIALMVLGVASCAADPSPASGPPDVEAPSEDVAPTPDDAGADTAEPPPAGSPTLHELGTGEAPLLSCPEGAESCPLDKQSVKPGAGAFHYRYVPLCTDGSGDHAWTLGQGGRAPTCASEEQVRCVDGSRPLYYLDQARDASGDVDTDRWVFFHVGGANCGRRPAFGLSTGESCGVQYFEMGAAATMGTAGDPAADDFEGILSPAPRNHFAAYNRVFPSKCTFDKYVGDAQTDTAVAPAGDSPDCDPTTDGDQPCTVYFHGRRLWAAMLADLTTGDTGLPALGGSGAPRVVLAGNSNGASGLTFNVDELAERFRAVAAGAEVFAVLDNHFNPALETEAAFDTTPVGGAQCGNDVNCDGVVEVNEAGSAGVTDYDHVVTATSDFFEGGVTPVEYEPGGDIREQFGSWWSEATASDASCRALHADELWKCFDQQHVLSNHVSTPVFIHQTLADVALRTKAVDFDPDRDWTLPAWSRRVVFRLLTYLTERDQAARAPGSCTEAREPHPHGAFAPDVSQHTNVYDDGGFFERCMKRPSGGAAISYHDAVVRWMDEGQPVVMIEHPAAGPQGATTVECGP